MFKNCPSLRQSLNNKLHFQQLILRNSGAYLYRKERKKRKGSNTNVEAKEAKEAKMPYRPSSDDGSSCCSMTPDNVAQEEIPELILSMIILVLNHYLEIEKLAILKFQQIKEWSMLLSQNRAAARRKVLLKKIVLHFKSVIV